MNPNRSKEKVERVLYLSRSLAAFCLDEVPHLCDYKDSGFCKCDARFMLKHARRYVAAYQAQEKPSLSVDDREEKPFNCTACGRTYEACRHWEQPE